MKRSNSSRSLARRIASNIRRTRAAPRRACGALRRAGRVRPSAIRRKRRCRSRSIEAARALHRAAAPPRGREFEDIMRARILPFVGRQGLQIGAAVPALPDLVAEDRETDRPEDDEAENHGDDFERASSANRRRAAIGRPPNRSGRIPARRTNHPSHYPPCPLSSLHRSRGRDAFGGGRPSALSDWERARRRARAAQCKKALHSCQ